MLNQKYHAYEEIMAILFFNKHLAYKHDEINGKSTLRGVSYKLLKDVIAS